MSKLKKCLTTIVLAILCVFCFSSCVENENYQDYKPLQGSMFTCIESYEDPYLGTVKVLVDRETRIIYLYYHQNSNTDQGVSGMTVLYDSNGEIKKYNGVITD